MKQFTPQGWLLKCALTAVLCLSVYAAISYAGPKAPPLPTSRDGALTLLDRYMQGPVPDVLLVGSSLSARLNEEYFDTPDVKVLGLAGGSPITALEVALARERLPRTILVEMNILERGEDSELVQKFTNGAAPGWPRPVRSAIAFYERWHHPPPDRSQAKAAALALLGGPPSDFDNRIYLERAVQASSAAPSEAVLKNNLSALKRLVARIEARGSRVYFYSLPVAPALRNTAAVKATAAAAHAEFPDRQKWISLDGTLPDLRWADGIHLDERSAVMVAKEIDVFLKSLPVRS
jgi:hypothetical protein